jgi:hypothetical protein
MLLLELIHEVDVEKVTNMRQGVYVYSSDL